MKYLSFSYELFLYELNNIEIHQFSEYRTLITSKKQTHLKQLYTPEIYISLLDTNSLAVSVR